jgi:hypothetical protein
MPDWDENAENTLHSMQKTLKRNAILVSGLALFFWWAFGFAKHDPALRSIIPFGEDPYDAVSSFGVIAAALLALVSAARAFLQRWAGRSGQPIYVLRAQVAVPFCVLVSVAAEAVAMARHTSMWLGSPGCGGLLTIQASLVGFSLITLSLVSRDSKVKTPRMLKRATAVCLGTVLALVLYPERLILGTSGHLATVVFGAFLLFVPVSALIKGWLPETPQLVCFDKLPLSRSSRYAPFVVAAAIGLIVGATAYFGELSEEGIRPRFTQILFVGGIYVGLGAAGLLIGYVWLGRLLGFVINEAELQ